jgi:hypothetical protein
MLRKAVGIGETFGIADGFLAGYFLFDVSYDPSKQLVELLPSRGSQLRGRKSCHRRD